MAKPVRMADIAEKLDISVVSVSKALAGKPGVSEEMRAKIVALAKQLGYEGTKVHSELAGTGNIGVLVSDRFFAENAFYTNLYRSLVLKSGNEGFTCMSEIVTPEAEQGGVLPALVAGRKVDGIIFMGNLAPAYLSNVEASGLPYLMLDFQLPGHACDCVISDNMDGGFALTEHLLRLGRRQIGFVGSIRATSSIMDRYLGYQKALRLAGVTPREDWLLEDRDGDGRFIPIQLPGTLPEAFLCSCDEVAYNLVTALRQIGKRVPEDVAVCGYDDFRFATLCQPPLTTYRVNVEQMASAVVAWLARKIRQDDPVEPMMWTVPGRLVVRESTGTAAE
ncbi:MAG: LacI family transcriptional regulator [Oscillibacter sp.]|nr:LacI family transcriptional regulator [Oscillibacter sp.]